MARKKRSNKQICLECQRLLAENKTLRQEIAWLKKEQVRLLVQVNDDVPTRSVFNKESSLVQKIAMFRSLFKGRDDVYALRYERKRDGKAGYAPVCKNSWQAGLCLKPKINCSDCTHKDYLPLDDQIIEAHLRGEKVIGLYPMLKDDSCWFIVLDFDEGDWQADARAVVSFLTEKNLPVALERSRSGNGAHIWFFFNEPVPAAKARKLGSLLITAVMQKRHQISFKSYDRMIPAQDFLTKDGLGNLIALPLQGHTARAGNTCFVDIEFKPFKDQWQFIDHIRRFSGEELYNLLGSLSEETELGELSSLTDYDQKKPWQKDKEVTLGPGDFPLSLTVTMTNGLFIPTQALSSQALNKIKRLAAFPNPEFYKKQAMRFSTWNTPRIIACHQEHDDYIQLPRGCFSEMEELFEQSGIKWQIDDLRQTGRPIQVTFNGQLRVLQQEAAQALIKNQIGVLCATTAFGKTVTAISLIAHFKVNTLVLVNSVVLMQQWHEKIVQFLEIAEPLAKIEKKPGRQKKRHVIGRLGGSHNDINDVIDVVVFNSALDGLGVKDFIQNYGLVIVDECHHVAANTFEKVLAQVKAKHVVGLSATPVRQDGKQPIVYMQCGPIVYRDDAKKQAEARPFSHVLLPRLTSYQLPLDWDSSSRIQDIFTDLSLSNNRNQQIYCDVMREINNERNVMVLTDRKEHVQLLVDKLSPSFPAVISLTGSGTGKQKKARLAEVSQYPSDQPILIVATGRYVGEGFDLPRLDTLFLVMPFSWKGTLAQYAGRLHRLYQGKNDVQIFDYVDVHVPVLERMYGKRLKGYKDLGYKISEPGLAPTRDNFIFVKKDYWQTLARDLASAREVIWISSNTLVARNLVLLKKVLKSSMNIQRESKLFLPRKYFREHSTNILDEKFQPIMQDQNILLQPSFDTVCNAVVIDGRILWYGSLAPLGFVYDNSSIMRIESPQLAKDMQGILLEQSIRD